MAKQSRREWTERELMAVGAALFYCICILFAFVAMYYLTCGTSYTLFVGIMSVIMSLFFFANGSGLVMHTLTKTSISFEDKGLWSIKVLGKRTTKRFIPYDEIQAAILGPRTLTIEYRPKGKKGLKHENLVDEEVTESLLLELSAKGVKLELD